ncbi:MAG: sodium:calcium antiporter [Bacteroidetes bacterium]|nr:MAG: sodium:calcium antiporter [Bacteroidota bacterium]TAG90035.1 MAG: sodium:calcium antiporter [Bacteroidota bacterium]
MEILISLGLIAIGVVLTVIGSNILVDGASAIAKKFNISDLIIGLTIVAFGTSSPELAVNIMSSISGKTDIAIGNILGSNIFNVFIILGIAAVIYPVRVQSASVWIEIPMSLLAALMVGVMANDIFFDGGFGNKSNAVTMNVITRTDALTLLGFFVVFMYYTVYASRNTQEDLKDELSKETHGELEGKALMSSGKATLFIIGGLVALYFGSDWLVQGAIIIAKSAGLSDAIIGLTIIAAGTSVPELATSATAAYKKNSDIAIGNVVGSNIFNIFFILGVSGLINPLPFNSPTAAVDISMTILSSIMMFTFTLAGKGRMISKGEGSVLIGIYIAYVAYLISTVAK